MLYIQYIYNTLFLNESGEKNEQWFITYIFLFYIEHMRKKSHVIIEGERSYAWSTIDSSSS